MSKKYLDLAGLSSYDQKIKEYIDDGDVLIDSTLTQADQAADAKITGDEIYDLKNVTGGKKDFAFMNRPIWNNGLINTISGQNASNTNTQRARVSRYFNCKEVSYVDTTEPMIVNDQAYKLDFRVMAYLRDGNHTYVGTWNGVDTFHISDQNVPYVQYFDFTKYPEYDFRIFCGAHYTNEGGTAVYLSDLANNLRSRKIFHKYARNQLRILFIGNSLTQDSIAYLPPLMQKFLPDTSYEITNIYYGGNTLAQIYDHLVNDDSATLSLISNNTTWFTTSSSIQFIVKTYPYDIVCMQGYYNYNDDSEVIAYNNIKDYIVTHNMQDGESLPLKFITLIHAPKRDTLELVYAKTLANCGALFKNTICEDVIPTGTAIYYATKTSLNSLGDQGGLSPDGTHAQEGLPVLIENYTALLWIADYLGEQIEIYGTDYRFTADDYTALDPPGPNLGTGVITGTDEENLIGQECAIQAYKFGKEFCAKQGVEEDYRFVKKASGTGDWVTITDGAKDVPMASLTCEIPIVQSGSGDPSPDNIRTITGKTTLRIIRAADRHNIGWTRYYSLNTEGIPSHTDNGDYYCSPFIPAKDRLWVRLSMAASASRNMRIFAYDADSEVISMVFEGAKSKNTIIDQGFKLPDGTKYVRVSYGKGVNGVIYYVAGDYNPRNVVVDWNNVAGTVYCGNYNAITGILTVTHDIIDSYAGEELPGEWISDRDVYAEGATPTTGAQVLYRLAEPRTYQVGASWITTLYGLNNVWNSIGGISFEYAADPQMYVDGRVNATRRMIAGIEETNTASKNYTVGDMFIMGDDLYKVIADIASGGSFTVGTNISKTTVAELIKTLLNA